MVHSVGETQPQTPSNVPPDPRKPDGASDPGLHRDRSFGSVSGLNTISEGLKSSPLRKPVLKRFADLFVCSPSANRRRQQQGSQQQHQQSPISKMCVPLFGSTADGKEVGPEEDLISVDSAGMLFTSLSKESGEGKEESLFLESKQTARTQSIGNEQSVEKRCDEGLQANLRIKVFYYRPIDRLKFNGFEMRL